MSIGLIIFFSVVGFLILIGIGIYFQYVRPRDQIYENSRADMEMCETDKCRQTVLENRRKALEAQNITDVAEVGLGLLANRSR